MSIASICITGTPGVGKSSLAQELCRRLPSLCYVDLGAAIRERQLFSEWDDEMNASILDEDKVLQYLGDLAESRGAQGGIVVDFHSIGFLPGDFFKLAIVLTADTATLWDRLEARGYDTKKIQENVEAEIFKESTREAIEAFGEDKVVEFENNTPQDAERNLGELLKLFL